MKEIGIGTLVIGVLGMIGTLAIDTSVETLGGDRVHNIGLLNAQQNFLIVFTAVAVAGVVILVFNHQKSISPPQKVKLTIDDITIEDEQKKCPSCAEKIKLEAIKCRYCGNEFNSDVVDEEIKQHKETKLNRETSRAAKLLEIEMPDNSYICEDCGFMVEKDKFKGSNLFCPDCSAPLKET